MTTSQIIRRDDQTFIRLGRHDAPVPAPPADAILQLINSGRSHQGVGSPPGCSPGTYDLSRRRLVPVHADASHRHHRSRP